MALTTPTVGIQDPNLAGQLGGLGDAAIQLQQANQRSATDIAAEQDYLTSQLPAAQAARREQMAEMVAQAQIRRNTRALFPKDATEFQLGLAERYQKVTGRMPPINAQTGQVDFAQMNREMAQIADKQAEMEMLKITGRRGAAGDVSAAERVKAQDALTSIRDQQGKIGRIRQLVTDKTINAVGPIRGSRAGQFAAQGQAVAPRLLGGDEGKTYEAQRELEMWTNEQVISRSEKMKGQLSDKDIKFLVQSVPKLGDTEEVWLRFLDTYEKSLQIEATNASQRAAGLLPGGEPPDQLAPPGFVPDSKTEEWFNRTFGANATTTNPEAVATEPGVFTDEELKQGTVGTYEGGKGFFLALPDGTAKRLDAATVRRLLALRGSSATTAPAATPARPPGMTTLGEMQSRVGDVPITPAPAIGNAEQFGPIAPAGTTAYDRTAFDRARGALTGTRP